MCGVVGLYHLDGMPVETDRVVAMTRTLVHRGPDGEGTWCEGAVGLGHRRLAIRGLGKQGAQPMHDPAGQVVVSYNGEIYNDQALRRELARDTGYTFTTACDTEILLAGWLAWGEGLFDRLDGMFAVVLWDRRRRHLVLARDPVGIKPLYLYRGARTIAVASEVKGLEPAFEAVPGLRPQVLHSFLAQGFGGPDSSLLDGVEQVAPGTVMTWDGGAWHSHRYWQPRRTGEIRSPDEAVEAFEAAWPRVVGSMLASDVPVGTLQSGGIDSSLVTIEARRASDLPAFVAGFDQASFDESQPAGVVASVAGARLIRVPVRLDDAEATFRAVVRHLDGELADSSALAVHGLCGEVRRHVTVALSGDGADEFFAGYQTYRASQWAAAVRPVVPAGLAGLAGRMLARTGGTDETRLPRRDVLARFLLGLAGGEPHCQWRRLLPDFLLRRVAGPVLRDVLSGDPTAGYAAAMGAGGALADRCLLADQNYYLPADMLAKADRMSMAHGLELRVPFLSREIMELAGRMDTAVLYPAKGPPKAPLRQALARRGVPEAVTQGTKKGFNVPVDHFLRTALRPLCDDLLDSRADALAPWLDPVAVRTLWREHRERRHRWGHALWPILTFATWLDQRRHV